MNKTISSIEAAVFALTEEQVQEFFESQNPILWIDDNILSYNNIAFTLLRAEYAENRINDLADRWDDEFIKSIGA